LSAERIVEASLGRIGRLMFDRSEAFADEFAPDGVLVGSEPGEVARGREAVRVLIRGFHALPARYTWRWDSLDQCVDGPWAWFFAEGAAIKETPDGARTERPYRLSGVLGREGDRWRWKLFHGSEPRA